MISLDKLYIVEANSCFFFGKLFFVYFGSKMYVLKKTERKGSLKKDRIFSRLIIIIIHIL